MNLLIQSLDSSLEILLLFIDLVRDLAILLYPAICVPRRCNLLFSIQVDLLVHATLVGDPSMG